MSVTTKTQGKRRGRRQPSPPARSAPEWDARKQGILDASLRRNEAALRRLAKL